MSGTPGGPRAGMESGHPGLGQFHRDPQIDLAQDLVELLIPEPSLRSAATDFSRNSVAWSREPPSRPSLSSSSARLPCLIARRRLSDRILDPLQGDQGIDAAERAQRDRRAVCLRRVRFGKGEAATCAARPDRRGVRKRQRSHSVRRCACVHVALSWSMGGKMPPRDGQELPQPPAKFAERPGAAGRRGAPARRLVTPSQPCFIGRPPSRTRLIGRA